MSDPPEAQNVPVKVYESADRLTVAAPMPGLEPDDIAVEITPGNQLILYGSARGGFKGENFVHENEWNPGPYRRELNLPCEVDASMANLTYGNGVLVVVLPLSDTTTPAHLGLHVVGPDHGERVGNAGHPVQRITSAEHDVAHHGAPSGRPSQSPACDDQYRAGERA